MLTRMTTSDNPRSEAALAPLVEAGWGPDPLEPAGAAELQRRIAEAPARRLGRDALAGQVALSDRELYGLGCTVKPLRIGPGLAGVWRRVLAFWGAVLCTAGLAGGVVGTVSPWLDDPDPLGAEQGLAIAGLFVLAALGGRWLLLRQVARLRALAAAQRHVPSAEARPAAQDPLARATVAVVPAPVQTRVRLLWLRGTPDDPELAEVRVVAERAVDSDNAVAVEDAVMQLSDVALRLEVARGLEMPSARPAPVLPSRASGLGDAGAPPARAVEASVPPGWEPDPLGEEGAAELARRLLHAPLARWSPDALAPLLVPSPRRVADSPPPWPAGEAARAADRPDRLDRRLGLAAWSAVLVWILVLAGAGADPSAGARWVGYGALCVAVALAGFRRLRRSRDPGRRLRRAIRAVADANPSPFEGGLPGAAGVIACAHGQRASGRRVALLHIRSAPADGRAGALEVRQLAVHDLRGDEPFDEAVQSMWHIADGADHAARQAREATGAGRVLAQILARATATRHRVRLRGEPLAWLAALAPCLLVATSIQHTSAGTWAEDGVANRVLSYAWVLLAGWLLLRMARRIRDPFSE